MKSQTLQPTPQPLQEAKTKHHESIATNLLASLVSQISQQTTAINSLIDLSKRVSGNFSNVDYVAHEYPREFTGILLTDLDTAIEKLDTNNCAMNYLLSELHERI